MRSVLVVGFLSIWFLACAGEGGTGPVEPVPGGGSAFLASIADDVVVVTTGDFFFTPRAPTVAQGDDVQWNFVDQRPHTATDRTGMELFDSGGKFPGESYSFTFNSAGAYPYLCIIHPTRMSGRINVPIQVAPASGGTGTTFSVTWSAAPPLSGYVFDAQIKRPGAASFVNWRTNQTVTGASFLPDAGPGTYSFRARLRNTGPAKSSQYSPVGSINVT